MTRSRVIRLLLAVAVVGLALTQGGPFGVAVRAQGPPDLEALHQRLLPLFELNGVVFTDADETSGRLVVGVLNRGLEQAVRARLLLLGVSPQSVDVVETEPIVQVVTLRDKIRPVMGGLQIRFSGFLCSLSFNAVRGDDVSGFVTASHCSDTQGAVDGTLYYQPLNQSAEEFIGHEIADSEFFRNSNGCPKGRRCRYSDANFSDGADGVEFALGRIAKTTGANNGLLAIAGDFGVSAEGAAVVGDTANKVGRTSGWTRGRVSKTCANTGVQGSNIVFLCQNFVDAGVGSGDSGAPVFKEHADGSAILLGTLWGGNSSGTKFVYSPLAGIERELGALSTCAAGYFC